MYIKYFGGTPCQRSFIRALDSGGMVWEGSMVYATLESALQALDDALATWMKGSLGHEECSRQEGE